MKVCKYHCPLVQLDVITTSIHVTVDIILCFQELLYVVISKMKYEDLTSYDFEVRLCFFHLQSFC
jgi:hypothetical protein